jgi:alpha-1,3-fucosyltransferase
MCLLQIDSDDAKFNEYFWWKDYYRRSFHHHRTMCDVCQKLHTAAPAETKTYDNMKAWWVDDAGCAPAAQIDHHKVV